MALVSQNSLNVLGFKGLPASTELSAAPKFPDFVMIDIYKPFFLFFPKLWPIFIFYFFGMSLNLSPKTCSVTSDCRTIRVVEQTGRVGVRNVCLGKKYHVTHSQQAVILALKGVQPSLHDSAARHIQGNFHNPSK